MSENIKMVILTENQLKEIVREAVAEVLKAPRFGGHNDKMLTAEEAAAFLNYSRDWIYRNKDKIGGRRIGRRGIRFFRADLEAWIASRQG